MSLNLRATRDLSKPRVVLYQYDTTDALNPRGLLMALAEEQVGREHTALLLLKTENSTGRSSVILDM